MAQSLTIQDLFNEIEQKTKDDKYIFRGEPNTEESDRYGGKVSSSLWREYPITGIPSPMSIIQRDLLEKAKSHITHEASDVEILSEIQHLGGKTNLIDFTTDVLIALFFACSSHPNKTGRIILMRKENVKGITVQPQIPQNRIISQKSVFLMPCEGFLTEVGLYKIVEIDASLKKPLLEHLKEKHGISSEYIYNDLQGFITQQSIIDDTRLLLFAGLKFAGQKNYNEAIECYSQSIKLNPNLSAAYLLRSQSYEQTKQFQKSIEDFNTVINLNPKSYELYQALSGCYERNRQFDKAIEALNKAMEINPNSNILYRQAVLYKANEQLNKAVETCYKAIETYPTCTTAYDFIDQIYQAQGEINKRVEIYQELVNTYPDVFITAYLKRAAFHQGGIINPQKTLEDCNSTIKLDSENINAYVLRATIYAAVGKSKWVKEYGIEDPLKNAIADCDTVMRLNPENNIAPIIQEFCLK